MVELRTKLESALSHSYDIERELAGAGMSRVFVALERALGRRVVIKVLPPELAAGVNTERFRREIQLSAQLNHPHIVPMLAAGELEDLLYYTMPYIEGESLRAALERGPLDPKDVVRILRDVVDAIAYAHSRGVIHRDIKPANILTQGAHSLVTDFGVAKAISAALPATGVTSGGFAIGTPAYMAPEQLAADPGADHRVDIYAVGLLAYELLSGASPFTGTSPQATMAAQLTRVPEPLQRLRPDVPGALSSLIQRCLEKLPENRPASAQELLEELDAISTPRGVMARSPSIAELFAEPAKHAGRLALVLFLLLAAAGGVLAATKVVLDRAQARRAPAARTVASAGALAERGGSEPAYQSEFRSSSQLDSVAQSAMSAPVTQEALNRILATFEDSLRQELLAEFRRDSVSLSETLRAEVNRRVADSVARLQSALRAGRGVPPQFGGDRLGGAFAALAFARRPLAPGEKRVLVPDFSNRPPRPDTTGIASSLADSLRAALRRDRTYNVISAQVAREVFRSEDPRATAAFVLAGAILTGTIERRRNREMVVRVFISEPGRNQQPVPVASVSVRADSLYSAIPRLMQPIMESLAAVSWPAGGREGGRSGRRGAPPPGSGSGSGAGSGGSL